MTSYYIKYQRYFCGAGVDFETFNNQLCGVSGWVGRTFIFFILGHMQRWYCNRTLEWNGNWNNNGVGSGIGMHAPLPFPMVPCRELLFLALLPIVVTNSEALHAVLLSFSDHTGAKSVQNICDDTQDQPCCNIVTPTASGRGSASLQQSGAYFRTRSSCKNATIATTLQRSESP